MDQDCWTFLAGFSSDELENRGILRPFGDQYLLRKESVCPLLTLMKERRVARLVAREGHWFLTSDGEFANRGSLSIKRGRVTDLGNPGDVFTKQNRYINPHFDRSHPPGVSTVSRGPNQPPTPKYPPLTVGDLAEMKSGLRRLANKVECVEEDIYPTRILNLRDARLIPRLVAQVMLLILQARNNLEHPPHKLSSTEETAVRAAWEVVREWALAKGLDSDLAV